MGSVKDLLVTEAAYEDRPGVGTFVFSDRYSVFDWGEMPDHIPGKGKALAVMAAFNFEELERRGIRTHYQGLLLPDGKLASVERARASVQRLARLPGIEAVLTGDGWPVFRHGAEALAELAQPPM